MRYAFVTISILAIWIAIIIIVYALQQEGYFLPIVALVMTVVLFLFGFVRKK
jgi:hypothetical protein